LILTSCHNCTDRYTVNSATHCSVHWSSRTVSHS